MTFNWKKVCYNTILRYSTIVSTITLMSPKRVSIFSTFQLKHYLVFHVLTLGLNLFHSIKTSFTRIVEGLALMLSYLIKPSQYLKK